MYVTVPYNKVLFSILYFLISQSEFDFGIAHVCCLVVRSFRNSCCWACLIFTTAPLDVRFQDSCQIISAALKISEYGTFLYCPLQTGTLKIREKSRPRCEQQFKEDITQME
jgi:hypothetical protein